MQCQSFNFAEKKFKGPSYKSYYRQKSATGHSETGDNSAARAEYEAEMKKRFETKMNWGI